MSTPFYLILRTPASFPFLSFLPPPPQSAKVGFPLDRALVAASLDYTAPYFVSKTTGKFGTMDEARWSGFLDWLSEAGLLTTKIQSRAAPSDTTATLDGLRAGDVGDRIPRDTVPAADLFTNSFL